MRQRSCEEGRAFVDTHQPGHPDVHAHPGPEGSVATRSRRVSEAKLGGSSPKPQAHPAVFTQLEETPKVDGTQRHQKFRTVL